MTSFVQSCDFGGAKGPGILNEELFGTRRILKIPGWFWCLNVDFVFFGGLFMETDAGNLDGWIGRRIGRRKDLIHR